MGSILEHVKLPILTANVGYKQESLQMRIHQECLSIAKVFLPYRIVIGESVK